MNKNRNLGSNKKFIHNYVVMNSRLDTIQDLYFLTSLKDQISLIKKVKKIVRVLNSF